MKFKKITLAASFITIYGVSFATSSVMPYLNLDSHEGARKATVVAGQPFYMSTGKNSSHDKTVFPFSYVSPFRIEKPASIRGGADEVIKMLEKNLISYLTPEQATVFKDKLREAATKLPWCENVEPEKWKCVFKSSEVKNVFDRFGGSLTNIMISYNFGYGYWSEDFGAGKLDDGTKHFEYVTKPNIEAQTSARDALIYAAKTAGGKMLSLKFSKEPLASFQLGDKDYTKINHYLFLLGARTIIQE